MFLYTLMLFIKQGELITLGIFGRLKGTLFHLLIFFIDLQFLIFRYQITLEDRHFERIFKKFPLLLI